MAPEHALNVPSIGFLHRSLRKQILTFLLILTVFASSFNPFNVTTAFAAACAPSETTYSSGSTTYHVLKFTSTGSCEWTVPAGVSELDVLIVGGGGGGGGTGGRAWSAGGGAGGGFKELVGVSVIALANIPIFVGAGGSGGSGTSTAIVPTKGANSIFNVTNIAYGGGSGGHANPTTGSTTPSLPTGSPGNGGGGAAAFGGTAGALSGTGYFNGGAGNGDSSVVTAQSGGGGGGANGAGADGTTTAGGDGGVGKASSITGSNVYYAGGGGGGKRSTGSAGSGGSGVGGAGGVDAAGATVALGSFGGGGGGGGAASGSTNGSGGNGGDGVVIVRYAVTVPDAPTAVTGTAGVQQVTVSWTAPANDGGAAITSYTATASPGGATCTDSTTSCTVTGLTTGTAYTFTVIATNSQGSSSASTASAAVTPGKSNQTIAFTAIPDKTYGDAAFTATATSGSGLTVTFTSGDTSVCTVSSSTITVVGAGTCSIAANQSGDSDYNAAPTVTNTFTVAVKPITMTVAIASRDYDGTTDATVSGTPTLSGLVSGDANYVSVNASAISASFLTATAGINKTVPVTLGAGVLTAGGSGNRSANYSVTLAATPTATIAKANQSALSFSSATSTPFGQALTLVTTGGSGTGEVSFNRVSGTCLLIGSILTPTGTGSCVVTATRAGDVNYNSITTSQSTITIQAVSITLTATNQTVTYGEGGSSSFSITSGALVSPDAVSSVTYTYEGTGSTVYAASTTRPANAGTYSVTPSAAVFSTGSSSNYTIMYSAGTLTIQKASLTVTAGSQTQWSTATITPTASITSGSLVGSDAISGYSYTYVGTGSTSYPSSSTAPSVVGTYTITPSAAVFSPSSSANNYNVAYVVGALNLVAPVLAVTVTAGSQTISSGGTVTPSFSITSGTMAGNDNISSVTYTYAGTGSTVYAASTTAPSDPGTYSVTPSAAVIAPGNPLNYSVTYAAGVLTISAPSNTEVELVLSASIGSPIAGSSADVNSTGLQSSAPYTLMVQSTPQIIAAGFASGGVANFAAPLPANLEPGWHLLTFTSVAANGNPVKSLLYFEVSSSGVLLATSTTAPPADLPHTGMNIQGSISGGVSLLLLGLTLIVLRRLRRP